MEDGRNGSSPRPPHHHSRRVPGPPRNPHHSRRRKPHMREILDDENAAAERLRSPASPLSPPKESWSASPEGLSSPRSTEWPLSLLHFSGGVSPNPPSPVTPSEIPPIASPPTSSRKKSLPSRLTCVAAVTVALVIAVLVGSASYVMLHRFRRPQAAIATVCKTKACSSYSKLLHAAVDEELIPCDNFYKYVCGAWEDTHESGRTVFSLGWDSFIGTVDSKLESLYGVQEEPASVQKAVTYWHACISVLNSSNVPGVKQALEKGGIAWPRRNPKPDFLNAMFFMSQRVNIPVFLRIFFYRAHATGNVLSLGKDEGFVTMTKTITTMHKTRQLANHMGVLFRTFGGTDQSRLSELTEQFEGMVEFFVRYSGASDKKNTYFNSTAFLQFTPTVSLERWNSLWKLYTGITISGAQGVMVEDVEYLAAVFQLHKKYGEAVMNDIVEGLAVESLISFTDPSTLESMYGNADDAKTSLWKSCLALSYNIFGYAINYVFLRSKTAAYDEVKKLAQDILEELPRLLSGNSSLLSGATNGSNFEAVFAIMEKSQPGVYLSGYTNYPDMTKDPLRNWMQIVEYGKTKESRALKDRFISTTDYDYTKFKNFQIIMTELLSPVFSSDAHWAIRYGGVGVRIVAALLSDYIEGSGKAQEVYHVNQGCLSGKSGEPFDDNLQAAVASVGVLLRLYEQARSKRPEGDPLVMDIPSFKSEQLPFIFGCYLLCGENGAEELCNTPMMHSADFARAFACRQDSPMNPSKKCWMLPP